MGISILVVESIYIRPATPSTRARQGLSGRAYVLGMVQSSMHVDVGGTGDDDGCLSRTGDD